MSPKSRNRGRILTPDGLGRLQQAIHAWELENEIRCTQEKLRELTIAEKPPNGLDPGTISKILEAEKGVDPKSIRCLFKTLGLELDEADLISASRSQFQVDANFVGREGAIVDLNALVNRDVKVIVIQARGGVGKTTLARKYLQQEFSSFLEFPIAKETKDIASIESLIEEKLRQLGEEPGREFFVSLDRLKRKLQNERIGILIDNLEPALDSTGKFIEPHRRYVELLRVLADPSVQSVTLITTRERLRESSVTVENYILRSLDLTAWEQFFQSRNLSTDTLDFAALHNAYGGNAKAMDIIRSAILEDYAGDIAAYWQANQHDLFIERDLEDLVTQQFDRLQQIDLDAYNLLCRMGCYRYQDVPTVPIEGLLCLLWDVPENRQRRVVKSLQDRSLVEFANGEYWLHPVIRGEAISRLRISENWKKTNYKAAEFWTEKICLIKSLKDVITAFEAYYHCIEIQDFEKAGSVLLKRRYCNLPSPEILGRSLYKLGLLQQLIPAVNLIIDHTQHSYNLALLYDMLGVSYQILGNIHEAIRAHESARDMLVSCLQEISKIPTEDSLKSTEINKRKHISLVAIGICKVELWEIEEAIEIFEEINTYHVPTADKTFLGIMLAFLYSTKELQERSFALAEKAFLRVFQQKKQYSTGYGLFYLGATYKNLGELNKAFEVYSKTITYAETSNYVQVKARAVRGIAEIYREQKDTEQALHCHVKSIKVFEELGAKFDLAESYHQLGITYKVIGDFERSSVNLREAIRLFGEIEAPKQIERVRRSMNNPEQPD